MSPTIDRFDRLTVRQARLLIDSDTSLERAPVTRRFYFGTWGQAGHGWFIPGRQGRPANYRWGPRADNPRPETLTPWGHVDGRLYIDGKEGLAQIHHAEDGEGVWWTGIGFPNRFDDRRGGCNGNFLFDARLSFDEAIADARQHFSVMFDAWDFDVVEDVHGR